MVQFYALGQSAGQDQRHLGDSFFLALAQVWCDIQTITYPDPVSPPEFDDVQAQFMRYLIHVTFQRIKRLGRAIAAIGARHRNVGIDDPAVKLLVGAIVSAQPTQAAHRLHRQAMRTVGAGIGQHGHLLGNQGAVRLDPGLKCNCLGMSGSA